MVECLRKGQYTTSIYLDRLYETVGDEYSLIGEYINSKTKVTLKHNKCGYEFNKNPSHFLAKPSCPNCCNRTYWTQDSFVNEVETSSNGEYSVIGEYKGTGKKILVRHNKCGCEYSVVASSILRGVRCPECFKSRAYSIEEYKELIKNNKGNAYEVTGEYINNNTPITVKHTVCGSEFEIRPIYFATHNCKCKICGK